MSAPPAAAVYDCMIYVQAAFDGYGPAASCLEAAAVGQVRLFISEAVVTEVADVLGRYKVRRRREHLTHAFRTAFIRRIQHVAELVDPVSQIFSYPRDPHDEPYLNLAIAASADYLVTRDRDLLDLQSASSPPGEELRVIAPHVTILDPVEFLTCIAHRQDEAP